ncbi:MAG: porin family protein [Rhodobacteraceae bacterium]|nr:porin family protein [Paracoccaceae bacterium]
MKPIKSLPPVLILLGISTSALAGNFDTPMSVNPVPQAAVTDWNGFYAGAQVGFAQGALDVYGNGVYDYGLPTEGTLYGGFAGYNIQRGNFVFGGEAAYGFGKLEDGSHTLWTEDHIDLKARAGYSLGNALVYGFAGYSMASMMESAIAVPQTIGGVNYGIGVDYQINNGLFVGLELIGRAFSGDFDPNVYPGFTAEGPIDSINLRVGKQF